MTLPIDLVLVRHGNSEGNAAKRLSERGDDSAYTLDFRNRHTASFRLTKLGREQAKNAGIWLKSEFKEGFDRYLVSEYIRAMETGGLLGLPDASWFTSFYLAERDWGELDICPEKEREERFGAMLRLRDVEPFFWRPPNGESLAQLCLRLDRVLSTLHRECGDKRVIIVCHGEVIWGFRILLERMSQERFKELHFSKRQEDRIYNCQVLHYTRANPETGELNAHANWMRAVRPTESPAWTTGWQKIERPRHSNDELLKIASHSPTFLE